MSREPTPTERFVEQLTAWLGSVPSLMMHTAFFIASFALAGSGYVPWDTVLLVLTTVVSLEAIYLSLFIQMTVNRQARELHEVSEDVEDIQEDIEEISEDVEEMQEDVAEISEDVEEISEDVEDIQEDVEELSEGDDWDLKNIGTTRELATMDELQKELKDVLAKIDALKNKSN